MNEVKQTKWCGNFLHVRGTTECGRRLTAAANALAVSTLLALAQSWWLQSLCKAFQIFWALHSFAIEKKTNWSAWAKHQHVQAHAESQAKSPLRQLQGRSSQLLPNCTYEQMRTIKKIWGTCSAPFQSFFRLWLFHKVAQTYTSYPVLISSHGPGGP